MPQTLPQTTASVAVVTSGGSTLPAGTYACIVTQRNQWGETLGATEVTGLVIGANQGIQITSPLQPGSTTIRAYLTLPNGAAGTGQRFIENTGSPFTRATARREQSSSASRTRCHLSRLRRRCLRVACPLRLIARGFLTRMVLWFLRRPSTGG